MGVDFKRGDVIVHKFFRHEYVYEGHQYNDPRQHLITSLDFGHTQMVGERTLASYEKKRTC